MTEPIEACHRAVGARVEHIRKTLGKTQDDIAKIVGLTRASIANIETGRQRLLLNTLEDLSVALGTTPKNLLKGIWW